MHFKALGGRLALLAAALIWGSSFIVMKDAVDDIPVFMLLSIRFTIAAVLLTIVFLPRLLKCLRSVLLPGAVCGTLLLMAYAAQTFGLTDTTPGKNAFLTSVYCILTPFATWAIYRTRPTVWNWSAAALCLIGIGFVSLKEGLTIGLGDGLTLLGGALYAPHLIALSHYSRKHDPFVLTTVQFGFTAALAWLMTLLLEPGTPLPAPDVWPHLLYLAFLATAAALLLQAVGQKLTPPSQAAILLALESVFGVIFSVFTGRDVLTGQLFIGFTLIFMSIIISETQLSFLRKRS